MKLNELQAKFAEVTGETSRSPNKAFLIRRISEALQAASAKAGKAPEAVAPDAELTAQTERAVAGGKLTRLEVPELQARYLEVVGRPTGSTNKAYMIWKIREAQKGRSMRLSGLNFDRLAGPSKNRLHSCLCSWPRICSVWP
jgi:hypothetical protein